MVAILFVIINHPIDGIHDTKNKNKYTIFFSIKHTYIGAKNIHIAGIHIINNTEYIFILVSIRIILKGSLNFNFMFIFSF